MFLVPARNLEIIVNCGLELENWQFAKNNTEKERERKMKITMFCSIIAMIFILSSNLLVLYREIKNKRSEALEWGHFVLISVSFMPASIGFAITKASGDLTDTLSSPNLYFSTILISCLLAVFILYTNNGNSCGLCTLAGINHNITFNKKIYIALVLVYFAIMIVNILAI